MTLMPFTYPWIFRMHLSGAKTLLDVGSGNGEFMQVINYDNKFAATGVELYPEYIKKSKTFGVYKKVIKQDIRKIKFSKKSFDAVISSQVIEHLKKKEGILHIKLMEKIARKKVVIGTPNGHFHQEEYDNNPLQEHQSHWGIADFQKLNYQVYGQGLKFIYGEHGLLANHIFKLLPLRLLAYLISYIASPLVYFSPHLAAHIIAVKKITDN